MNRIAKTLAVLNALVAAAVLIVVPMMSRVGVPAPQDFIAAARQTGQPDSPFVLDVLSKDIDVLLHWVGVLGWLCYAALPVLGMNALGWAMFHDSRPDRREAPPEFPATE